MKHKTSELTGAMLDAAVQKAWGDPTADDLWMFGLSFFNEFRPSSSWLHGGKIIERERIQLMPVDAGGNFLGVRQERDGWLATSFCSPVNERGDTPLIAAMRAYVGSKLGDEVEL